MPRALSCCPVCQQDLVTTELACPGCRTRIQGAFDRCPFCTLPADHLAFLSAFLRSRGNLSGVGAELGLSFPTVSRRLDALLVALSLRDEPGNAPAVGVRSNACEGVRRRILEQLDRGEITAEEATRQLRDLR